MNKFFNFLLLAVFGSVSTISVYAQNPVLDNGQLKLQWLKREDGFKLSLIQVHQGKQPIAIDNALGKYTILYTKEKPSNDPLLDLVGDKAASFPDPVYDHIYDRWRESIAGVPLNVAGKAISFYPSKFEKQSGKILFSKETSEASVQATWSLDPTYKTDILVNIKLVAKQAGYYSIASPSLASVSTEQLTWGMIPGYFQSNEIQSDLVLSYGYGQGIPNKPLIFRERGAGTLSPMISSKQGFTMAAVPEPGQSRHPWEDSKNTHKQWKIGMSVMDRSGLFTPVVYHPVLGQEGSFIEAGESKVFSFRYVLKTDDWYAVYRHVVNDVYKFKDAIALKDTKQSLTDRILKMSDYLKNDSTSMWNVHQYGKMKIGAQNYWGGILGADKDAMKNSDYGAMWMLAKITNDSVLRTTRLPFARNFKLAQQQETQGFYQGAATGQYYLWKSKKFIEEWGDHVEPIGLTYYVMLDIGNMLLFEPNDQELKDRLRLGADRLLKWQKEDGSWEIAYDRTSEKPEFPELKDLRPTFYGLLVAYRILGDAKYLDGARKGGDWFVKNAVDRGCFLGVCGDFRFIGDFATGQSVQALLDLYESTKEEKYKKSALKTAQIYTTSVYTHPIPNRSIKKVKEVSLEDWQISQVGSRFEQGGLLGSANGNGPILLASHAGMFVRLFGLTQDSLYLDMARVAAWGQDAFVNPETHVASYYWNKMNAGVGKYPHHAWWQIGWITDYLLSEIELRSAGSIKFPRGFITPKVGPHQTYGFSAGKLFGKEVELSLSEGYKLSNPRVDYLSAIDKSYEEVYLILLNNSHQNQKTTVSLDGNILIPGKQVKIKGNSLLDEKGNKKKSFPVSSSIDIELPAYGLTILKIKI
jgi:hypothetical protein